MTTTPPAQASDKPMRAAFEAIAPAHNITIERFKQRPDSYKFEYTIAQFAFFKAAYEAGVAATPRATADVEPPVPVSILRAALKNAALGQSSYGTNYDGNKLGRAIEVLIAATKGAKP